MLKREYKHIYSRPHTRTQMQYLHTTYTNSVKILCNSTFSNTYTFERCKFFFHLVGIFTIFYLRQRFQGRNTQGKTTFVKWMRRKGKCVNRKLFVGRMPKRKRRKMKSRKRGRKMGTEREREQKFVI